MEIIITGSLGHVGKPLTEELVGKGHTVTVISSKAEKREEIKELGATAAIGSLEDVDFLVSTFTGADAVYCMIPPNYTAPEPLEFYRKIGSNYAQAIKQTDVKRVVHLSSWGAHLDQGTGFILGSHNVENILNELTDVAVTHLRAGYIYYNLYNYIEMIKTADIIGANYGGDDQIVMVDPKDIAAAAAEELQKSADVKKVRYVASDDRTPNEVAQVLGSAIGKPDLKWITFTDEQVQEKMEKKGMPPHIAAKSVELGASIHSGALREDYDMHPPTLMGKVKLEEFAKEFAAAFQKN
jgi:uncharacterized protein YbjT (DUF2867 family)